MNSATLSLEEITSCLSGYDPDSLRVEDGKEIIKKYSEVISNNLKKETLPVKESLGRVLAKDIISSIDVPSENNAAMDGYAFNSKVLSLNHEEFVELKVIGQIFAGEKKIISDNSQSCFQITTGAIMPSNCDTVIPQEYVELKNDKIKFSRIAVNPSDNRRLKGEDLSLGKVALKSGRIIKPSDLGLLASLGVDKISVYRKLRVAFFSTGNELSPVGERLTDGSIYDSNSYTIFGMLKRIDVEIIDMGIVPDDPIILETAFRKATQLSDVVITSGGVSVGEADYTKNVMKKIGDVDFWKVAMRPGRPMVFGRIWADERKKNDDFSLLFGLPGNPVAVMVTFYIFVKEALINMMGSKNYNSNLVYLKSHNSFKKKPGRTEYRRGKIITSSNKLSSVMLTGAQGSGILSSMSDADCLIVLDHDIIEIKVGEMVPVLIFDGLV